MEEWKNSLRIGAAYIRVSSDDQLEYSPDSQLKLIREYAKRDGYLIPEEFVYQDDGISGKSADKRPAFRLMIAMAKEDDRAFDCIFVLLTAFSSGNTAALPVIRKKPSCIRIS